MLGAAVEAVSERDRIPGGPKPLWHRWGMAVWLAAALGEEIHVIDDAGSLRTEHRFQVWGQTFLSLNYTMDPKGHPPTTA